MKDHNHDLSKAFAGTMAMITSAMGGGMILAGIAIYAVPLTTQEKITFTEKLPGRNLIVDRTDEHYKLTAQTADEIILGHEYICKVTGVLANDSYGFRLIAPSKKLRGCAPVVA